jgi:hypothetical protein
MGVFVLFILLCTAFYAARLMIIKIVQLFRRVGSFFDAEGASEAIENVMDTSVIVATTTKKKDEEALFQIGIEGPQKTIRRSRSKRRAAKKVKKGPHGF